jgi:transposase
MDKVKSGLTTFEIEKKLGISRNRLKGWVPKYIKPSLEETRGPGTPSRLSKFDLYRLMLFKHLVERGYKRESAAERIKTFRLAEFTRPVSEINLVALIHRGGGKYLDPNYKPKGRVKRAWGMAYPDVIYGKDMQEIFQDLQKFDILKNKSDDVDVINFKKIRNAVDAAFK